MYKKILLAGDGSDHSLRAAKEAVKIAKASVDSQITIVFVADHDSAKNEVLHSGSSAELDLQRRKKLQPAEEAIASAGINYHVEILRGTPGPAIVDYANTRIIRYVGHRQQRVELFAGNGARKRQPQSS